MTQSDFTSGIKMSDNDWMSQQHSQKPYFDPTSNVQQFPGYSPALGGYNGAQADFTKSQPPEKMTLMPFSGAEEMTAEFGKLDPESADWLKNE